MALVYPGEPGEEALTAGAAAKSGLLPFSVAAMLLMLRLAGPIDEELFFVRAMRKVDGLVFHAARPPQPSCTIVQVMLEEGKEVWRVDGDGNREKLKVKDNA